MKIDMNITGMTAQEASLIAAAAVAIESGDLNGVAVLAPSKPTAAPQTVAAPSAESGTAPVAETRPSASSASPGRTGRPTPTVDPATIAAVAAANPAKAPKAEKPAATGRTSKPKPRTAADDSDMTDDEVDALPESDVITPAVKSALKGGKAVTKPADEDEGDADDDIPFAEEEEEKPKAVAKTNGATNGKHTNGTNGHAKPAKPAGDFPEALLNARKLRDILAHLIDEGVTDPDDLKARCLELKEQGLPYLEKIPDLEERVKRTIEIMDVSGD